MQFTGREQLDIISVRRENQKVSNPPKKHKKRYELPKRYLDSGVSLRRAPRNDEYTKRQQSVNGHKKTRAQIEQELAIRKVVMAMIAAGTVSIAAIAAAISGIGTQDAKTPAVEIETLAAPLDKDIAEENNIKEKVIDEVWQVQNEIHASSGGTNDTEAVELIKEDATEETFTEEAIAEEAPAPPAVMPDKVSDNVIEALKGWETFHPEAYLCPSGKLTVGWGHTKGVYEGQTVTEEEAENLLREDLEDAQSTVTKYAESLDLVLTQGQFDALVSFAYNCGIGGYQDSGITELLAQGDVEGAAAKMNEYIKGKDKDTGEYVVMPGLVTRRALESSWLYE